MVPASTRDYSGYRMQTCSARAVMWLVFPRSLGQHRVFTSIPGRSRTFPIRKTGSVRPVTIRTDNTAGVNRIVGTDLNCRRRHRLLSLGGEPVRRSVVQPRTTRDSRFAPLTTDSRPMVLAAIRSIPMPWQALGPFLPTCSDGSQYLRVSLGGLRNTRVSERPGFPVAFVP